MDLCRQPNLISTYRGVNAFLAQCLNSVLNVKALVGFNQEKALVGAFSVTVQPVVVPMDRFTASHLHRSNARGSGSLLCGGFI